MSIDHPHGGPSDDFLLSEVAALLSQADTGETYILVEPVAGNRERPFVTNDTRLAHDTQGNWRFSYYVNGKQQMDGVDMIVGLI